MHGDFVIAAICINLEIFLNSHDVLTNGRLGRIYQKARVNLLTQMQQAYIANKFTSDETHAKSDNEVLKKHSLSYTAINSDIASQYWVHLERGFAKYVAPAWVCPLSYKFCKSPT